MTTAFKVTWPNGETTRELSETSTVEGYAMERWGCNTLEELAALNIALEVDNEPSAAPATGADSDEGASDTQEEGLDEEDIGEMSPER